nr:isoform 4 of protein artemis [Quercus suber]
MSTFDGIIAEFPDICIDRFRQNPLRPAPLAGFLSHVHTDHTDGLASWRSPFIYCSAATKAILLRLERHPHRMNFARGVLEARRQHFRHLRKVLRAVPLDRPTLLELSPGRRIRFTLLDANHCVGAVMFLIEGQGRAVLYTGDIRCEAWWLDQLARSPSLLPYFAVGREPGLKRLDRVYLDTTFVAGGKEDPYRDFPPKLAGVQELLRKMQQYPDETRFYFDSWTFGYEDVWDVLAQTLDSQIHVDEYRFGLYRALAASDEACKAPEAAVFAGHFYGNHHQAGILTDRQDSRLHSCEKGTACEIWTQGESSYLANTMDTEADGDIDFVRITPIITRHNGLEIEELGAGGGKGDLDQRFELEIGDQSAIEKLITLCAKNLSDQPQVVTAVLARLQAMIHDPVDVIELDAAVLQAGSSSPGNAELVDVDQLPIEKLVPALVEMVKKTDPNSTAQSKIRNPNSLSRTIVIYADHEGQTFPYSRHSSYAELCMLIERLKPKDIYPCTVNLTDWTPSRSMGFLFGHLYSEPVCFEHDQTMLATVVETSQTSDTNVDSIAVQPVLPVRKQTTSNDQRETTKRPRVDEDDDVRIIQRQEAYDAALDADHVTFPDVPDTQSDVSRVKAASHPVVLIGHYISLPAETSDGDDMSLSRDWSVPAHKRPLRSSAVPYICM